MTFEYKTIDVSPLSPALGGIISGVDIAGGISDEQFAEIRQAFIDYSVIFFRDQQLTPDSTSSSHSVGARLT